MWPEVWGAKGFKAHPAGGADTGGRKRLFLSLWADKGPKEMPEAGQSPRGLWDPNGSATRMGGYASLQEREVGEGQTAVPAGTGHSSGGSRACLREGRAGLVGCSGSTVGDGGKETEGEKGMGSPRSLGQQTGNAVLLPQGEEADCWRQGRSLEGPSVSQAGGDGGWAVGCLWPGGSRLMGFGSITWSKSGRGRE